MPAPQRDAKKLPSELREGSVFDAKYKVECVLGMGGMGVVLLAHDLKLRREVAVKVLLPEHVADQEIAQRFMREGRAVALIQGEHVCRVLDVSQSKSGLPYMVLEWLVGRNLEEICREEGPLDPRIAVDYLLQACQAVAQAHARGIVHRDIKPSNLFLTHGADGDAVIKVLDFGIAKMEEIATKEGEPLTETGVLLGSPQYMAPEQMKSARKADPRSDIWSFGASLFKLIVGRAPFLAPSLPELCASVLHDPPPLASSLRAEVPSGLDLAIRRCLEKDPANRFQTLDELATAIAPFASSAEHGARSAGRIRAIQERGARYDDTDAAVATTVDPMTDDLTTAEPSHPVLLERAEIDTPIPPPSPPPPPAPPPNVPAPIRSSPTMIIAASSGEYATAAPSAPIFSRRAIATVVLAMIALFTVCAIALGGFGSRPRRVAPSSNEPAPTISVAATTQTQTSPAISASVAQDPGASAEPSSITSAATAPSSAPSSAAPPSSTAAKPSATPRRPPPQTPKNNKGTTSDRHG